MQTVGSNIFQWNRVIQIHKSAIYAKSVEMHSVIVFPNGYIFVDFAFDTEKWTEPQSIINF